MSEQALNRWLPAYEFDEHHETTVAASPAAVERALRAVSLADMRVVRVLWWLRQLPAQLSGRRSWASATTPFLEFVGALRGVILEERPGELVAGLAGEFWRLRGGESPRFRAPEEFAAYDRPGIAKAVINFEWRGAEPVRLATTTRVHVADPGARRRFARYWRVIGPFSGLTRIVFLRAVKRRAET